MRSVEAVKRDRLSRAERLPSDAQQDLIVQVLHDIGLVSTNQIQATQRMHHLQQLRQAVLALVGTNSRADRVNTLRARYQFASDQFDVLHNALPRTVQQRDKQSWASAPASVLEAYAQAEGL